LPLFIYCQQSLRYGYQSFKPLAKIQSFIAENFLASHSLLVAAAVLSSECVEKLEILGKKTFQNIRTTSPLYFNHLFSGTLNFVLTFLRVFALAIVHILSYF
jgi:hypothetical protein